jgi:hypothetical protein
MEVKCMTNHNAKCSFLYMDYPLNLTMTSEKSVGI